jgi:hypothetical protein
MFIDGCIKHEIVQVPTRKTQRSVLNVFSFFFYLDEIGSLSYFHSELIDSEIWILQTVGRTPWTGGQPEARPLSAQDNTNTEQIQTSMH